MGGSSGSGTQTTKTEPPAYQLPYLKQGLGYAQGLFDQGGPQQYQGNTVVPFSPQTEQALSGIEQRATQGSPLTHEAQNYVQDTLQGNYLDQSNPYLADAVNKAGNAAYQTITSQFARSGRNVNAAAPVVGDMLTGISSKIYGDAYNAERDRQNQALAYATPLAEQDYRDLSALQGVGSQVEDLTGRIIDDNVGRWDYEQNRPGQNLDSYMSRVSGNMGQTSITPMYRNRTAGALGGAMSGAQLGSQFGGWGTAIGAIGGGLSLGGWG